jgi:hypothetical protein
LCQTLQLMQLIKHSGSILLVALIFHSSLLPGQETICIPYSAPAEVDGHIKPGEWDDAETIQIPVAVNKTVTVKLMHDSTNLFVAYLGHLESAFRFPEVVLDINNDKTSSWMADDWWFHASASDCVSNGAPNNYDNCLVQQPDWDAVPNMTPGAPFTDSLEVKIPFITVGIDLPTHHTIGLAVNVTNTSSIWNYWPSGAKSLDPSTWASAEFCSGSVATKEIPGYSIPDIVPNPFSSHTLVRTQIELFNATITIHDSFGRMARHLSSVSGESFEIARNNLASGLYFIQIIQDHKLIAAGKIVIMD